MFPQNLAITDRCSGRACCFPLSDSPGQVKLPVGQVDIKWISYLPAYLIILTHCHWVTHICIIKLTIIGCDNGLSPKQRQAIIWTNAGILLIGPLGTTSSRIESEIIDFHSRKCMWKWPSFCLCLNLLITENNHHLHLGEDANQKFW